MTPIATSVGSQHPWDLFDGLKDQSYLHIDQGLRLEYANRPGEAIHLYEKGLEHLDKALDLPTELPGATRTSLAKLKATRTKLFRTRQQIVFRLRELSNGSGEETGESAQKLNRQHPNKEDPPSYEEVTRMESSDMANATPEIPSDAEILFSVPSDVNIFYIRSDGKVTVPHEPSALHIYRFAAEKELNGITTSGLCPALLQVGSWVYPLIPGKSPVLKSTSVSYMFPDLDDSLTGNAIGVVLPPTVSEERKEAFAALLMNFTAVHKEGEDLSEYEEYIQYSNQVAQGMNKGAEAIGKGLIKASIKGGELLQFGTEKIKKRVAPAAECVEVDHGLKTSLEAARWVSGKAVTVSGYLVSKAGVATLALGRFLAPYIQSGSARAISHFAEQSEEKSNKQLAVASELASGSIEAISTVYMALENSSNILAENLAKSTVEVVKHKYGSDAGTATDDALTTAGNTYLAVYNAAALGPKGLAKRVAKDTSKVAVGVSEDVIGGRIDMASSATGPDTAKNQKALTMEGSN